MPSILKRKIDPISLKRAQFVCRIVGVANVGPEVLALKDVDLHHSHFQTEPVGWALRCPRRAREWTDEVMAQLINFMSS